MEGTRCGDGGCAFAEFFKSCGAGPGVVCCAVQRGLFEAETGPEGHD
jgi:hypothetical protein